MPAAKQIATLGKPVSGKLLKIDDTLIAGYGDPKSNKGGLTFIDLLTEQLKTIPLGGAVESSPLWVEKTKQIVCGAGDGCLYVFNLSGEQILKIPLGDSIRSTPIVQGTNIYASVGNGTACCYDVKARKEIWKTRHGSSLGGLALHVDRKWLVFGDADGLLHVVDSQSGHAVWSQPLVLDKPIISAPCLDDMAFVGSGSGIHAVNLAQRKIIWAHLTAQAVSASPCVAQGRVFVACMDRTFYALDAERGRVIWSRARPHSMASTPVCVDSVVYLGSNEGAVLAFDALADAKDKTLLGVYTPPNPAPILGSPLVEDGVVFVGSESGKIFAVPFHLGEYENFAAHSQKRGDDETAASLTALAAEHNAKDADDLKLRITQASELFVKAKRQDKAAHLLAAQPWAKPVEIATSFRDTADLFFQRDRQRAANLFYLAADYFDEAEMDDDRAECERRASLIDPIPRLTVRELTSPHFDVDDDGTMYFEIKNRGRVAADVFIRAGGVVRLCTKEKSHLDAGESMEVALTFAPTGEGDLIVDLKYYDASGRDFLKRRSFSLRVRPMPDVWIKGDAGVVRAKRDTKIRIDGDVMTLILD